ncbi:MAG TPA: hypothetical protein DCQ92_04875 [Verrucomicrobia subdivision 3 bacterium]|nr:hypothetical protein [Limisphaerales bacterium]
MSGKSEHFVPRHNLRPFCIDESKQIGIATVEPFRFIGSDPIDGQCQEDYFYGKSKVWDDLLTAYEDVIAPVLKEVCNKKSFDDKELGTLQMMAVILHKRTRKAMEAAKVTPRYMAVKLIQGAIKRGELPPCPDGEVTEEMFDFTNTAGSMIFQACLSYMDMQTLRCKLLQSSIGSHFITSDNPAVVLNQFCVGVNPNFSFAGFAKSGFQLLLPISPNLCLFFYDEKIYKVGNRRDRLVEISKRDVEIVNALQVQSAEKCLYFHSLKLEQEIQQLVFRYASLRVPIRDSLKVIPMKDGKEFLHTRKPSVKLPATWDFCRRRKHIKFRPGDSRSAVMTELVNEFIQDVEKNPIGEDIFTRLKTFCKKIVDDFDQSSEVRKL